ncbi:MAG: class II fructose-bisphosphate aldolase [Candidatus Omnitrophota bacterium]
MVYNDKNSLLEAVKKAVEVEGRKVKVCDIGVVRERIIDDLVYTANLSEDSQTKKTAQFLIWEIAKSSGVYVASVQELYEARGRGEISGFTVPAVNMRVLTYDMARAIIRAAIKINCGAFIFEIAKSEIGYTNQRPAEYTCFCLAAAVKEGFQCPLFIQGDHFQVKAKNYIDNPKKELDGIKTLMREAVSAGFLNIDIDSSTLVDLNKTDIIEEQRLNYEVCAELTKYIREIQPEGINISIGGEIGEVGGKNSTPEELNAFMDNYLKLLPCGMKSISKISIQTGTSHGGVVLPDGSIAKVKLDFDTLKKLSDLARNKYAMSGAVQHGASTLPKEAFHKFPEVEAAEVHLATQFQNMVYDSSNFSQELKEKIYRWIKKECADEKKEDDTDEQFIYKTRKKAVGPFKKDIMNLPNDQRSMIGRELEEMFDFLFKQLKVMDTRDIVVKYISRKELPFPVPIKGEHNDAEVDYEGAD